MTDIPPTQQEREEMIQELVDFGMPRDKAEQAVALDLGEFEGDVLEED